MSAVTSPADILRAARELISTPEKWTQHDWARDRSGKATIYSSPDAACWCAMGAIRQVTGGYPGFSLAEDILEQATRSNDIGAWNDRQGRTHKTILRAFDRAIALAEQAAS